MNEIDHVIIDSGLKAEVRDAVRPHIDFIVASKEAGISEAAIHRYLLKNGYPVGSRSGFGAALKFLLKENKGTTVVEWVEDASASLSVPAANELNSSICAPPTSGSGHVYIAAPVFNRRDRWVVEEVRGKLVEIGVTVVAPIHDEGVGSGEAALQQDLAGIENCHVVLAFIHGSDSSTMFKVGYATAKGIPVVALAENMRLNDLEMLQSAGCQIVGDVTTAIYRAAWKVP